MKGYEFKYVCEKCGAIHWYKPEKCSGCGHDKIKKVKNG